MSYQIRTATAADADGITDVQIASWRAGYGDVFPQSVLYADDFESSRREFWASWRFAPGHRVCVAVDTSVADAPIVAFASYGPERERARGYTGRGEVWAFYVHPGAWGNGLADDLMDYTELRLRAEGFETAVLWVLEDNPRARRFYERSGWTVSGISADVSDYGDLAIPEVEYRKPLI